MNKIVAAFGRNLVLSCFLGILSSPAFSEDLSQKLDRPVRFLAWNISQKEIERLARVVDKTKLDTNFEASDYFEFDVFVVSVKDEPAFIDSVSNALAIEKSSVEKVASGKDFLAIKRFYPTKKKVIRFVLFDERSFVEADSGCRTAGLVFILLAPDESLVSGDNVQSLFRCSEG